MNVIGWTRIELHRFTFIENINFLLNSWKNFFILFVTFSIFWYFLNFSKFSKNKYKFKTGLSTVVNYQECCTFGPKTVWFEKFSIFKINICRKFQKIFQVFLENIYQLEIRLSFFNIFSCSGVWTLLNSCVLPWLS